MCALASYNRQIFVDFWNFFMILSKMQDFRKNHVFYIPLAGAHTGAPLQRFNGIAFKKWQRIPTPVCALARNDLVFRHPVGRTVVAYVSTTFSRNYVQKMWDCPSAIPQQQTEPPGNFPAALAIWIRFSLRGSSKYDYFPHPA